VIAVLLSGLTATVAGVFFVISQSGIAFHGTVNGTGFIAIAILLVSQRKIMKIPIFSFLFASVFIIAVAIVPFLEVPSHDGFKREIISFLKENKTLFLALPFVFSLFILALTSKRKMNQPLFLGKKW
jgi:simple sugar transport system permease protein